MLCKNPFMKGVVACGCGQCLHCRVNKRREWSNRLMWEKESSTVASFVTLTYRDEEVNDVSLAEWSATRPVVGNLVLSDVQKWLKRLRKEMSSLAFPGRLRYFVVGEYGEHKERPHYHAALFGFPSCIHGKTRKHLTRCCGPCDVVGRTWGKGSIQLLELNKDLAQYLAKYVTKKWTKEDLWTKEKLKGRKPEFSRMSLKPGIGADAIKFAVDSTVRTRLGKYVKMSIDAPVVLKKNGSTLPLGRYLRRKWRQALGRNEDAPQGELERYSREMQVVFAEERAQKEAENVPRCFLDNRTLYLTRNRQKLLNAEAKFKIFSKKGSL